MTRTAVVLFNLGGPDSAASIKPFLFNFFMDKNIIRLPLPLRFFIAKMISIRRSKREAGSSYGFLGGKSPLLANTNAQRDALQAALGSDYKVFTCMRYWHPMANEVAKAVKTYAPERIVLLPLYPQFSTTTTRSSAQAWHKAAKNHGIAAQTTLVCCYPQDGAFITASANAVRKHVEAAAIITGKTPRVLFSAHGLPEDVITDGDPYQKQCEEGAAAIANEAGLQRDQWRVTYQSRVGPKKWIGPATDEQILEAGRDGAPLVVYPHAFVNEHVETLVELDIEYKHIADDAGVPFYSRVPVVGTDRGFIAGLAALVKNANDAIYAGQGGNACCQGFRRCPRQNGI